MIDNPGGPGGYAKPVVVPRSAATQPKPDPFPGYMSAKEQEAAIQRAVLAAQLPAKQALDAERLAQQQQASQQTKDTTGYYQALAQVLGQIAPATSAGFNQAAGADAAFGKGFSTTMQMLQGQTQGEANNVLNVSGGQNQAGAVTKQIGGQGLTDVLYGLGGYQPATNLQNEGAAFGAAAAQQPATAAGQGAQQIQRIGAQDQANLAAINKARSSLAAQIPGLRSDIGSQLGSQQTNLLNAYNNDLYKQKLLALSTGKAVGSIGGVPTVQALTVAAANNPKYNAAISRSLGFRADQYGNPIGGTITTLPGFKVNDNGVVVKTSTGKPKKADPLHGLTQNQVNKNRGNARLLVKAGWDGGKTYDETYEKGIELGLPEWILTDQLRDIYKDSISSSMHREPLGPPVPKKK